ncbi:hypothetical protein [Anaplasma bovis]|uniref:hypothetical protein n=1 Tax=Anaplasma bovis TaxID=186733 RepID=UPI002FF03553
MLSAVIRFGVVSHLRNALRSCRTMYSWEFSRNLSPREVVAPLEDVVCPPHISLKDSESCVSESVKSGVCHDEAVVKEMVAPSVCTRSLEGTVDAPALLPILKQKEADVSSVLALDVKVDNWWHHNAADGEPLVSHISRAIDGRL